MVVKTKGAKSNRIRNIPLIYVHQDGMPILVASLGGMPKNPNWYYNVKANPNLKISTTNGTEKYFAEEVSKEKGATEMKDHSSKARRGRKETTVAETENHEDVRSSKRRKVEPPKQEEVDDDEDFVQDPGVLGQ